MAEIVILFGLARRTARKSEKVSRFYRSWWRAARRSKGRSARGGRPSASRTGWRCSCSSSSATRSTTWTGTDRRYHTPVRCAPRYTVRPEESTANNGDHYADLRHERRRHSRVRVHAVVSGLAPAHAADVRAALRASASERHDAEGREGVGGAGCFRPGLAPEIDHRRHLAAVCPQPTPVRQAPGWETQTFAAHSRSSGRSCPWSHGSRSLPGTLHTTAAQPLARYEARLERPHRASP